MRYCYVNAGIFDAYLRVSRWSRHRGPRLSALVADRTLEIWAGCIYLSISRGFLIRGR